MKGESSLDSWFLLSFKSDNLLEQDQATLYFDRLGTSYKFHEIRFQLGIRRHFSSNWMSLKLEFRLPCSMVDSLLLQSSSTRQPVIRDAIPDERLSLGLATPNAGSQISTRETDKNHVGHL